MKKRSVPIGANSFLLECTSIEKRCEYKISRVASFRLADNTEVNDLRKIKCFRKSEVSIKIISVCNVVENLAEHGIHCLPCSYTNDAIDMLS